MPRITSPMTVLSEGIRKINIHLNIVIVLTVIQLAATVPALVMPCRYGLYVLSLVQYYNSFWIAGPMLVFALSGRYINKNLTLEAITIHKGLNIICILCVGAGYVILGLTYQALLSVSDSSISISCGSVLVSFSQYQTIAIVVAVIHSIVYIYYMSACGTTWRTYIICVASMALLQTGSNSRIPVQQLRDEPPEYGQDLECNLRDILK
ncbi:uncharacterized protein TRIADDRAFT_57763 [Trichoplax adhaerens]|uniref:Uncharacterized protein n=1 Tax=Trichoplax adhaerens TaxID=10228 RepID=B3S0C4_TRIAD|nr:predicted protein [Trichoplax adhaerens]EDV23991.1 predicted protein [Trichoplax adhaerens]|eukprot:XP_002113517.1 predicted protein [Trichoplax adhaerens]